MDNRRQHTRVAVAVAAEIEAGGDTLEGETRDISEGGLSVLLDEAVADDASVGVTLILTQDGIEDPDQPPFVGAATVMWSAPTDAGQFLHGLRFAALAADARARLQRFLAAAG